jgi:hypothetical protein
MIRSRFSWVSGGLPLNCTEALAGSDLGSDRFLSWRKKAALLIWTAAQA